MDAEILHQVVQIKWLIVALVVGVLSLGVLRNLVYLHHVGFLFPDFARRARRLLDAGDASKLLALADARIKEAPGDPFAHWYRAQAAQRLGDLASALQSIHRAGELSPHWRENFIEPFVRTLGAGGTAATPESPDRETVPSEPTRSSL